MLDLLGYASLYSLNPTGIATSRSTLTVSSKHVILASSCYTPMIHDESKVVPYNLLFIANKMCR